MRLAVPSAPSSTLPISGCNFNAVRTSGKKQVLGLFQVETLFKVEDDLVKVAYTPRLQLLGKLAGLNLGKV